MFLGAFLWPAIWNFIVNGNRLLCGVILVLVRLLVAPLSAAVVAVGDVSPDVSIWSESAVGYIGRTSDGSLLIDSGSVLTGESGYLGYDAGANGSATITGAGSQWFNAAELIVGEFGDGSITVSAGGQLTSTGAYIGHGSNSISSVAISGAGSSWTNGNVLNVGRAGSGSLLINNGGLLSSTNTALGQYSFSTGTASVVGAGSKWTNSGWLTVTGSGSTLEVDNGGEVVVGELYASPVDLFGNGKITVANGGVLDADIELDGRDWKNPIVDFGSGGTLSFNVDGGEFGAGFKGNGSVKLIDGANITTQSVRLGFWADSNGSANVTGAGTEWTSGGVFYVGYFGNGNLTIDKQARISSYGGSLGDYAGSSGDVLVHGVGSQWSFDDRLYVGGEGSGVLSIVDGGLVDVTGPLFIDIDQDGDSFVNMATGGRLALQGDAEVSLTEFMDLINGTDAIRF